MANTEEVPRKPRSPAFVELVAPEAQSVPECTLEVEGRRVIFRSRRGTAIKFLAYD